MDPKPSIYPFEAHWLLRGGTLQTILASKFPGSVPLPPRKCHKIRVGPRSVLIGMELEPMNADSPIVLLGHGMGGCSESGYMRRIAWKIWDRGAGVFLLNHRGSGLGLGMSETLWNGGSSDDLETVVHYLIEQYPHRPLLLIGFSLSGNVLLKYLGEGRKVPSNVYGAFAVNPPIDLKVSSLRLSRGKTAGLFNGYYMKLIQKQARALRECFPDAFPPPDDAKSIWDFDVAYTAPAAGYRNVEEYYERCSAGQFLNAIRVPTTIVCARDDPFIPPSVFEGVTMNLTVNFYAPEQGGHMGYLANRLTPFRDRRWLDYVLVEWIENIFLEYPTVRHA